jgi:transcriptional regulator with XRE-family HTH domain
MNISNDFLSDIGTRLKITREKKRFSQKELSQLIEVAPNQYSKIEAGKVVPSLKTLARAAKILEVSADELIFGEEPIAKTETKNTALIQRIEHIENLPPEEKYIANELLTLIFTRNSLKNIVGSFESVPTNFLKK